VSEEDPEATIVRRPAPVLALAPPAAPVPAAPSAPVPAAPSAPVPAAPAPTPLDRLAAAPELFDLDQAAFVIAPGADAVELPFAAVARLHLPLAEVARAEPVTQSLASPLFGLIGPGGVLPRHYTATTAAEARRRSRALQRFLELLARRFTGMWVRAGAKYRPTRDPAPTERALDALAGMGTPGLAGRLAVPAPSLRYHAGHLAHRTRSAARLAAMLSEEAGTPVEIVEFAGGWLRLPVAEQTRLGRAHAALGAGAAAGAQIWDPQARFLIRLGPLDAEAFARLLPGEPLFERLCGLTRLFVGPEQEFVLNPLLRADAVPAARSGGARLGYTAWTGTSRPRRAPAGEAMLRPPPIT
jgi:type VI secretion system protein ImpH